MARPFSSSDAKQITKKHQALLNQLNNSILLETTYKENIKTAATKLLSEEVLNTLKNIPVEEIGKSKTGIRVKILRDNNYCNIYDLQKASAAKLALLNGISDEGAEAIKKIASDIAVKTQGQTKIRLNADNKTVNSTELVKAIAIYKNSIESIEYCKKIYDSNSPAIKAAIKDLNSASGTFKWLFSSKESKNKATEAFELLSSLLEAQNTDSAEAQAYSITTEKFLSNISKAKQLKDAEAWADFTQDSVSFITILEDICPGLAGSDDIVYGLPEDLAAEIQKEPLFLDGLNCTLRRYQEWGVKYILHQKRVLLGDEMGLGKTIQAIATMVSLKNQGETHFIVVCPASVVTNWCREIKKHSNLTVTKMHGDDKDYALNSWMNTGGALVTTFETTGHFNFAEGFTFNQLIVDEAHYIKNPEAQRSKNTTSLCQHADRILFMTGTALENNVDEMITLINILRPSVAQDVSGIAFLSSAPEFREKIAPVYYRRKRDDVLTELPDLIETKEWCKLLREEEKIYERSILEKRYTDARRVSWNVDNLENSSKARRLMEIVKEAESEGRKVLIFSFFLDTISKINAFLGDRCLEPINGSIPPQRRQEIIDEFEKAPVGSVLTAQIQSGGTGLNIQAASVVVICEPQFKPSIENQAIARAYRMGQSRNVLVYRLLSDDTIEEHISVLLEQKQMIFDAFADKSVVAEESFELDEKTFGTIIDSEIERITAKNTNQAKAEEKSSNTEAKSEENTVHSNNKPN